MKDSVTTALLAIVAILAIIWWPIAVIWSVNTLFDTGIPVNIKTWFAVVLLLTVLKVSFSNKA
jgi:hypothetical protein